MSRAVSKVSVGIAIAIITLGVIGCSPIQTTTPMSAPSQASEYALVGGRCHNETCLFKSSEEQNFLVGVATISGYYVQLERTAFEQTKLCESFIITKGSPALIESLLSLIEQGNTVYTKNDLDQPIISLNLDALNDNEKQRLVSSSESQQVSLVLLATNPSPQGVPVCFSHFEILRVKQMSIMQRLPPNTACTRLGVRAAFFEHVSGFRGSPFRGLIHPPTPSG